ncbi:acyltransferase family protein [Burkholderia cenocepacia]|uniref:acyltransferase family protein n=1 Tax=Burkholderia cenocepacia TaxID=95486 RepID=UPI00097C2ED2|nr:acyltransferase [Burkholderia cenocepacia]AQQ20266.1 hypothetical protein A8D61_18230 [Burkholderia cenocepacia]ONJ20020.1 hypothetical protein A8D82_14165 [Burkholderia cenocepacia]ONN96083.1 hypothetical protein A8D64_00535 [Burkholderia cenocepacia]ONO00532.1 hypothetical protein A8D62_00250 [Burkholderia cenocepacia]ONO10602.1 hypothetical protein A8D70_21015 [Burkholderia cenocepacia]
MQRYKYLDGLRGVAALVVVVCHFFQIFLPAAFATAVPAHLWERSIATSPLNIAINGNFAVSLFFVISGFVLSAPTFSGKDRAWYVSAALRRYPRLAIPALASTVFAWAIAETIGFHYKNVMPISGSDMPDFFSSITSLKEAAWQGAIGAFFFDASNYNEVLWTIRTELIGSFLIFSIIPFIGRSRFRWIAYAVAIWWLHDSYLLGFVLGAMCADVLLTKTVPQSRWWFCVLAVGLYLGSYPYYLPGISIWYPITLMLQGDSFIMSHVLGGALCVLSASQIPSVRRLFETCAPAFLGRISYSLYLVHFSILGSVGAYIAARCFPHMSYAQTALVTFSLTMPIVFLFAFLFTILVDEPAVAMVSKFRLFRPSQKPKFNPMR